MALKPYEQELLDRVKSGRGILHVEGRAGD